MIRLSGSEYLIWKTKKLLTMESVGQHIAGSAQIQILAKSSEIYNLHLKMTMAIRNVSHPSKSVLMSLSSGVDNESKVRLTYFMPKVRHPCVKLPIL